MDSQLLVGQITRGWRVNAQHLLPYVQQCKALSKAFKFFTIERVPRARNSEADRLANQAIDENADNLVRYRGRYKRWITEPPEWNAELESSIEEGLYSDPHAPHIDTCSIPPKVCLPQSSCVDDINFSSNHPATYYECYSTATATRLRLRLRGAIRAQVNSRARSLVPKLAMDRIQICELSRSATSSSLTSTKTQAMATTSLLPYLMVEKDLALQQVFISRPGPMKLSLLGPSNAVHRIDFASKLTSILAKFRMNRALTRATQLRFIKKDTEQDAKCLFKPCFSKEIADTPQHILLHCQRYTKARRNFVDYILKKRGLPELLKMKLRQYLNSPPHHPSTPTQLLPLLLGNAPDHKPMQKTRLGKGPMKWMRKLYYGLLNFYEHIIHIRHSHHAGQTLFFPPIR